MSFYITTPIFYPNARPHLGHAYSLALSDIVARYRRMTGEETYFLTGTDEHGQKVFEAAEKAGVPVEHFLEEKAEQFKDLSAQLDVSYDQFIRTSDRDRHWPGAERMWKALLESGDIYKKEYEGYYCKGCEAFLLERDLVDGKCPNHGVEPQKVQEENYFFRLSKYTDIIKEKIESGELVIEPESRRREILSTLSAGLDDVSFSRPKDKMKWGIPVPDDSDQYIYVWCDALVNYISALGFGRDDTELFEKFWPADVHVIGKDILRFHTAIWPGMLLSAGLPLPKKILVHGMILSGGQKMSKSIGNVIDPNDLIDGFGSEAVRFYLARAVSPFEDGEINNDRFAQIYEADLQNGIGNLASRILKMCVKYDVKTELPSLTDLRRADDLPDEYRESFERMEVNTATEYILKRVSAVDEMIQETKPFKVFKDEPERARADVVKMVSELWHISVLLEPILPSTATKIQELVQERRMPEAPLFPRIDS